MSGAFDILAWGLGAAAAAVLAVGRHRQWKRRAQYHRELIREFAEETDAGERGPADGNGSGSRKEEGC